MTYCHQSDLAFPVISLIGKRKSAGPIAYQLVQVIRRRLAARGEHASWSTLRRILGDRHRVTATFPCADGRTLHVRKATRAEPLQRAIYDALGIHPAPGGSRKTIVRSPPYPASVRFCSATCAFESS